MKKRNPLISEVDEQTGKKKRKLVRYLTKAANMCGHRNSSEGCWWFHFSYKLSLFVLTCCCVLHTKINSTLQKVNLCISSLCL